MKLKYISLIGLATPLAASAVSAQVVATDTVNQIAGTVEFTNAAPESFARVVVNTASVGLNPQRTATADATLLAPASGDYSVTVLANAATTTGTAHTVSPLAYLDGGKDYYYFDPAVSALVADEPAADVPVDFAECAGFVRVNFVDNVTGNPEPVSSTSSNSSSETFVGSGVFGGVQAGGSGSNTSSELFAVRGDALTHRITTTYYLGTIPYGVTRDLTVDCDQTVDLEIRLGGDTELALGGIRGNIDLRFENELPGQTVVTAYGGPYGHSGSTTLAAGYGPFQIDSLVSSDEVSPTDPYSVTGQMWFPRPTGEVQYFRTPDVQVVVPPNGYAFLGSTLIMEAGYLDGDVRVEGPDDCVNRFVESQNLIYRQAVGTTTPSAGGHGYLELGGTVTPLVAGDTAEFDAQYSLSLGTPSNVPGSWRPQFDANLYEAGNGSVRTSYSLNDQLQSSLPVNPGVVTPSNVDHCLARVIGRVEVNPGNPAGTSFNNPRISFNGGLHTSTRDYYASGSAVGTPSYGAPTTNIGRVEMCIPAGAYNFDTRVTAYEGGTASDTGLRPVSASFNCDAFSDPFGFDITRVGPGCYAPQTSVPFSSSATTVIGSPTPAASSWVKVNGKTYALCGTACSTMPHLSATCAATCGTDPTSNFSLPTSDLNACQNDLRVYVQDALSPDDEPSNSGIASYLYENAPATACRNVTLTAKPGGTPYDLTTDLGINRCKLPMQAGTCTVIGGGKVATVNLNQNPNFTFGNGKYQVYCGVNLECGVRNCKFDVNVAP